MSCVHQSTDFYYNLAPPPAGIAMSPAGYICFADDFLMSPLSFDNWWTDHNVDIASLKKFIWLKIW